MVYFLFLFKLCITNWFGLRDHSTMHCNDTTKTKEINFCCPYIYVICIPNIWKTQKLGQIFGFWVIQVKTGLKWKPLRENCVLKHLKSCFPNFIPMVSVGNPEQYSVNPLLWFCTSLVDGSELFPPIPHFMNMSLGIKKKSLFLLVKIPTMFAKTYIIFFFLSINKLSGVVLLILDLPQCNSNMRQIPCLLQQICQNLWKNTKEIKSVWIWNVLNLYSIFFFFLPFAVISYHFGMAAL